MQQSGYLGHPFNQTRAEHYMYVTRTHHNNNWRVCTKSITNTPTSAVTRAILSVLVHPALKNKCVPISAAAILVHSFIITRVDYCNKQQQSIGESAGLDATERMQRVLNSAARLIWSKTIRSYRLKPICCLTTYIIIYIIGCVFLEDRVYRIQFHTYHLKTTEWSSYASLKLQLVHWGIADNRLL